MLKALQPPFDFLINRPLVMMAMMAIVFLAVWYLKRCFPSQRFLWIMLLPILLSLGIVVEPQFVWVVLILNVILFRFDFSSPSQCTTRFPRMVYFPWARPDRLLSLGWPQSKMSGPARFRRWSVNGADVSKIE
jgi:hypothetical protein